MIRTTQTELPKPRRPVPPGVCICGKTFERSAYNQPYCPECKKDLRKVKKREWSKAYYERTYKPKTKPCIDCGEMILATVGNRLRCPKCAAAANARRASDHHGNTCIDCGASIYRKSTRCEPCSRKFRRAAISETMYLHHEANTVIAPVMTAARREIILSEVSTLACQTMQQLMTWYLYYTGDCYPVHIQAVRRAIYAHKCECKACAKL